MIDDDIRRLDEREVDYSLSRLESDIWQGVAARAQQRVAARRTASFQGAIMIVAVLSSAAAGLSAVRPVTVPAEVGRLTEGVELMPSTLLLGDRR